MVKDAVKKFKKYLFFSIIVAAFGEIYFYPFNSSLRFSTAIIVMNTILLIDEEICPSLFCISSGIAIFLQRSMLGIVFYSHSLERVLELHLPALSYYLIYGAFVFLFKVKDRKNLFINTIIFLAFSDIISNTVELLARGDRLFNHNLQIFTLVGFVRSISAYLVFLFYKKQELFLITREGRKRYGQLNLLVSNIQAEMFYLKKSAHDIENIMKESYALYEDYKENPDLKERTLNIALEIHEIKKDYYRVLKGFESFLEDFEQDGRMIISDMFAIIRENTYRNLKEGNIDINLSFHYKDNFQVHKYYHLFTIINNLIINAIDGCSLKGKIQVLQESDKENIIFQVVDNGEGIDEEILPYIFNPGFTTKYDERSGAPSTGIGLSHVQGMVNALEGEINVTSIKGEGTNFKVIIPKKILIG